MGPRAETNPSLATNRGAQPRDGTACCARIGRIVLETLRHREHVQLTIVEMTATVDVCRADGHEYVVDHHALGMDVDAGNEADAQYRHTGGVVDHIGVPRGSAPSVARSTQNVRPSCAASSGGLSCVANISSPSTKQKNGALGTRLIGPMVICTLNGSMSVRSERRPS